jgi:DNA-directed RNA polymerase specialized sigma24 family protein
MDRSIQPKEHITTSHGSGVALDQAVVDAPVSERGRFLAFLVNRVGDVDTAEDLLQSGVLHALRRADSLRDEERRRRRTWRIARRSG